MTESPDTPDAATDRRDADSAATATADSATRVGSGILATRVLGFVRELLVARYLGVGAHADVYGTVLRIPNLLQNLLGEQTLSAAFIPVYSQFLDEERRRTAGRFAGAVFGLLLAVAGGLALLGILLAEPVVALFAPGFLQDPGAGGAAAVDRFELAVVCVRIVFPMAGILVLSAWSLGVLNSHRRFFLPYVAPALWNAAIITAVVWVGEALLRSSGGAELPPSSKSRLLVALCWGALVGGLLQFLVQLPAVAKVMRGFRLSLSTKVEGVRRSLSAFGPVVAGRGVVQISSYVETLAASFLVGAVGGLVYAQRLFLLPISLFGLSVAAAELPELSRLAGRGEGRVESDRVHTGLRQMGFLVVPTVVGYLAFGFLVVGAIYRRGSFDVAGNWLVYATLAAFTFGLLPTTASRLLQNVFYALSETRYPAKIAAVRVVVAGIVGVGLMVLLDRYRLARWIDDAGVLTLGAVGLALGSAVGAWTEIALLVREIRSRVDGFALPWSAWIGMGGVAVVAAAAGAGVWWLVDDLPLWIVALVVLAVYVAVYLGASMLGGAPEARAWLRALPIGDGEG